MSGSHRLAGAASPEPVRRDFARLTVIFERAHDLAVRGQARTLPAGQRRILIGRLQRSLATAANLLSRVAVAGSQCASRRPTRPAAATRKT